jgi:hypothetical protein
MVWKRLKIIKSLNKSSEGGKKAKVSPKRQNMEMKGDDSKVEQVNPKPYEDKKPESLVLGGTIWSFINTILLNIVFEIEHKRFKSEEEEGPPQEGQITVEPEKADSSEGEKP